MSEPLTNCHTCGWVDGGMCGIPADHDQTAPSDEWAAQYTWSDEIMTVEESTGCPGWKPKPAAIPEHDRPGHRPNVDRAQVAALGVTDGPTLSAMLEQFEPVWGEDPPPRPPPENTDRAQVAALGWEAPKPATIKESLTVAPERDPLCDGTSADLVMVKRAEWDAALARIDALEGRVGEVERRGRTDSARFKATRRRDRLRRGGR